MKEVMTAICVGSQGCTLSEDMLFTARSLTVFFDLPANGSYQGGKQ